MNGRDDIIVPFGILASTRRFKPARKNFKYLRLANFTFIRNALIIALNRTRNTNASLNSNRIR